MKTKYANHRQSIDRLFGLPDYPNLSGWKERHIAALTAPRPGFEAAFIGMLAGWLRYADAHRNQYGSHIGTDGVLGDEWARIGAGLRGLLNGALGRLDAGTLDSLIAETLRAEDFDPDQF